MSNPHPTIPPAIRLIQKTVDAIEEQLDGMIELEKLAMESGMSFWHFLRIFRTTVGETLKDYIRRRRLTHAAYALLESKQNVLDIALAAGFESHEAFTRAFKNQFNISPRDFRVAGQAPTFPHAHLSITTAYLGHLQQGISREPEIIPRPSLRLVGMKAEYSISPDEFDVFALGSKLWGDFSGQLERIKQRVDDKVLFMCDIFASNEQYIRCMVMYCVVVDEFEDLPAPCIAEFRPPSHDATFTHRGSGAAWEYTMQYLFGVWQPESGKTLADYPVIYRFDPQSSPFSETPELEIWLALS